MPSAERSDAVAVAKEGEGTPRVNGEPAKTTQESGSRLGLKDLTNFNSGLGSLRKRSTGSLGQRAKPAQLKSNLRDFFFESKVHTPDGGKKEDGTLALIEAALEEGIDDLPRDEMRPSGSGEEHYTRLFTAQNEHHSGRTFRRTQSQFEEPLVSRKRASIDGGQRSSEDGATERKRSCAIVLTDDTDTVIVDPDDDDVFETSSMQQHLHTSHSMLILEKEGSPMSEHGVAGSAIMHHRVNFERTLSASVLERGEFAPPLRDHPNLPNLPNIEYGLPLVPTKDCQVHSVAFGCISAETLATEMQKLGLDDFHRKYVLIDCRYPYEYNGGHIKNAINLHDSTGLPSLFFPSESILDKMDSPSSSSMAVTRSKKAEAAAAAVAAAVVEEVAIPPPNSRIPVFYCEYSQKRGPTMAHDLRSIDRRRNIDRYPAINYDVMYLLECGYRNFFKSFSQSNAELFSSHCGYVEMKQEKKQLGKFKAHRKRGRARQVQQIEAASEMSPTTPAVREEGKGRRASMVAREKIRETLSQSSRLGGARTRLAFDSEDEKSPMKKKDGLKETDL